MKRITLWATAAAVLVCLSGLPLLAQGRGGGGGMAGGGGMGNNPGMGNAPTMGQGMGQDRSMGNGPMTGRGSENTGMNQGRNSPATSGKKTPDQLLTQNTKLASNLQPLLPAGANLQDAASGFKNLGQFVAAVHVSHNLGIPFDQLKDKMIAGDSLGKAIHELNPNLSHKDTKAAVKKGKSEAKSDIKAANS